MNIRLSEPAREFAVVRQSIIAAVVGVLASGKYVAGQETATLAKELAERCHVRYGIGTASGTMALVVGLKALEIKAGDEVITAPYTSICTTAAITHAGARIVFADIDPATLTLDPEQVARRVTARTRAIIPVHLHGQVAEMEPLRDLAASRGIALLEDAALAVGASYRNRPVGSLGDAAAVSFAPSKILGGIGWGGMLLTNDAELAERARQLAAFGPSGATPATVELEDYNAQLSEVQAAALRVKLPQLDGWLARRRQIVERLAAACDRLGLWRLHPPPWTEPAPRAFVLLVTNRESFLDDLRQRGVAAAPHFVPPLHLRSIYRRLGYGRGDFPVAERLGEMLICLPCHPHLSDGDVSRMIEALAVAAAAHPQELVDGAA